MSEWVDDVLLRVDVRAVAAALGLREAGGGLTPCPACGADRRGTHDARGPIGADGSTWGCWARECGAKGGVLQLVAAAVAGETKPNDWSKVRAWCASRGWCSSADDSTPAPPVLVPPRPQPSVPPAPKRPPADELAALWRACRPVTEDRDVAAWLRSRALDPATIEDLDLARALPRYYTLPRWAGRASESWAASGHRAVLPLFDAAGRMVSLRARSVREEVKPKALTPTGYQVGGLVFACALARRMLAGEAQALELVRDVGLMITEGDPDFLTTASAFGCDGGLERAPAVVGIESGAWTEEHASRVPELTRVRLWTHDDDAGDRYASKVLESLRGRRCWVLAREQVT